MSLGREYDLVLLPPRAPLADDSEVFGPVKVTGVLPTPV